jgi:hypothetical protein
MPTYVAVFEVHLEADDIDHAMFQCAKASSVAAEMHFCMSLYSLQQCMFPPKEVPQKS